MNNRTESPSREGTKGHASPRRRNKINTIGFHTTDDGECFTLFKGGNRKHHPELMDEGPVLVNDAPMIHHVPHEDDDNSQWRKLEERHVVTECGRPHSRIGRCNQHGFQLIVDERLEYVRYRDLFRPSTAARNVLLAAGVNFYATEGEIEFDFSCLSQSCFHFRMPPGIPAVRIDNKRFTVKRRDKNKWELAAENN